MRGILFASFGTSHADAQASCLDAVANALLEAEPDALLGQAYTSSIIRRVLRGRGQDVPDVRQALVRMAAAGVDDVTVQPGHLMPGEEFDKLRSQVVDCAALFDRVCVGEPLLSGTAAAERVMRVMAGHYQTEQGRAVVLMGHGTDRFSNVVYAAMNFHAMLLGRTDLYVGTVEAQPDLDCVMGLLRERDYSRVTLAPLMLVAGDHSKNDMAGDGEDSWASRLRAAGYEVTCNLEGLGQLPDIRAMYAEHARDAEQLTVAAPREPRRGVRHAA